jgi:hydroxypyruvate isomerase
VQAHPAGAAASAPAGGSPAAAAPSRAPLSANVSMLFGELPLLDRFAAAAAHGFTHVELWWPGARRLDAVAEAVEAAGVTLALLTIDGGDGERGDRGLLADPDPARGRRLAAGTALALDFAARVGCRRLYTLIGNRLPDQPRERQLESVRERLAHVADATRAHGIELLVEPVNAPTNGPQTIDRAEDVVALLDELALPGVRLLFDTFHVRSTEADVLGTLARVHERVGHVHLGDFPGRVEPGAGELDFRTLLDALDACGYAGTLGLEYVPSGGSTPASLATLARAGLPLPTPAR